MASFAACSILTKKDARRTEMSVCAREHPVRVAAFYEPGLEPRSEKRSSNE
jgi:hypothetical protein